MTKTAEYNTGNTASQPDLSKINTNKATYDTGGTTFSNPDLNIIEEKVSKTPTLAGIW